jgi:hypothetical protein
MARNPVWHVSSLVGLRALSGGGHDSLCRRGTLPGHEIPAYVHTVLIRGQTLLVHKGWKRMQAMSPGHRLVVGNRAQPIQAQGLPEAWCMLIAW